jgi:uncharacterized protein (UPF0276 family)
LAQEPFTGVGIGLRHPHLAEVAMGNPGVPFWEIAPENVVGDGGRQFRLTRDILERDPIISHGLGLSLGGFDPFDPEYLGQLGAFLEFTGSPWHSEHLCFTSVDGANTHELLPMPFTRASARHVVNRTRELKSRLPVPFILENITYYAELGHKELEEPEWMTEILEEADVGWLLDINNVFVNGLNHGFDPIDWLLRMPLDRVVQMHIAGHDAMGGLILDTHGAPVIDPVIQLMQWVLARIGRPVPVLLERDNEIPELPELLEERRRIQAAYDQIAQIDQAAQVASVAGAPQGCGPGAPGGDHV